MSDMELVNDARGKLEEFQSAIRKVLEADLDVHLTIYADETEDRSFRHTVEIGNVFKIRASRVVVEDY
jgi:hypothetical protein